MKKSHTIKGGAWFNDECVTRSASRHQYQPGNRDNFLSLRLVLDTAQPPHIILRGGSWFLNKPRARSAVHASIKSSYRNGDTGLRLALDTDPAQSQQENIQ